MLVPVLRWLDSKAAQIWILDGDPRHSNYGGDDWNQHQLISALPQKSVLLSHSHLALAGWLSWREVLETVLNGFRPNSRFSNTWLNPCVTETGDIAALSTTFEAKLLISKAARRHLPCPLQPILFRIMR